MSSIRRLVGGSAAIVMNHESQVSNNSAGQNGGGVFNIGALGGQATLVLNDESRITRNTAGVNAGGVFNVAVGGVATVTINDDTT